MHVVGQRMDLGFQLTEPIVLLALLIKQLFSPSFLFAKQLFVNLPQFLNFFVDAFIKLGKHRLKLCICD